MAPSSQSVEPPQNPGRFKDVAVMQFLVAGEAMRWSASIMPWLADSGALTAWQI
jgi:hypothetical protein